MDKSKQLNTQVVSVPGYSSSALAFEFESLLRNPDLDPEEQGKLGAHIGNEWNKLVGLRLSPEDRSFWIQNAEGAWPEATRRRISATIDRTLVDLAPYFGTAIYMSRSVQQRLRQWEEEGKRGIERVKKLNRAVENGLSARYSGKVKLSVTDPELKANKNQAVQELTHLFKLRKRFLGMNDIKVDYKEARAWYRKVVHTSDQFYLLQGQMLALFDFVEMAAPHLKEDFIAGKIKAPANLFDQWGAWRRNLDPETFRQQVSRLPKL